MPGVPVLMSAAPPLPPPPRVISLYWNTNLCYCKNTCSTRQRARSPAFCQKLGSAEPASSAVWASLLSHRKVIRKVFFLSLFPLKINNGNNFTRCIQGALHIHKDVTNLNTYERGTFINHAEYQEPRIWKNKGYRQTKLNSLYSPTLTPFLSCVQTWGHGHQLQPHCVIYLDWGILQ